MCIKSIGKFSFKANDKIFEINWVFLGRSKINRKIRAEYTAITVCLYYSLLLGLTSQPSLRCRQLSLVSRPSPTPLPMADFGRCCCSWLLLLSFVIWPMFINLLIFSQYESLLPSHFCHYHLWIFYLYLFFKHNYDFCMWYALSTGENTLKNNKIKKIVLKKVQKSPFWG
jgi:hypothetical protein